jgi:hypothetical protein
VPESVTVAAAAEDSLASLAAERISVTAPFMMRLRIGLFSPSWPMSACVAAAVSSSSLKYSSFSERMPGS